MSFLDKTINELINTEFKCSCGKTHLANIQNIAIGKGVISQLSAMIDKQVIKDDRVFDKAVDKIFVVSDVNTEGVAGKDVKERLAAAGYSTTDYVFPHASMHAEDRYVDEMRAQLPEDISLIIA
ncbi:MAG: sn-glycerol-1-phosphate dehydrogenase, partial [Eubacterium sp.]